MKEFHAVFRRSHAILRLTRRRFAALAARPARASVATPVCLLVRKPSRRVVAELSSLLAVSPIVLGLSALVALPWPQRKPLEAKRYSEYGALASLGRLDVASPIARARTGVKLSDRAPIAEARHTPVAQTEDKVAPAVDRIGSRAGQAVIGDDGRLIIDGESVRLDGIAMPDADAACRRLDGVEVRCLERVVARLSIVTQQGALSCRTNLDASGERVGTCLAGKIDLAQDLVQARLARRM